MHAIAPSGAPRHRLAPVGGAVGRIAHRQKENTMIGREYAAAFLSAAAVAVAAGTAAAATSGYSNCGSVAAGGRSWALASTGIGCPVAKGILKTLAPKSTSGFHRLAGTFAGMKCNSIVGAGKRAFQCSSRDGRTTLTALSH
jgi:hypothetical protein